MDTNMAVLTVNTMHQQLAQLVRTIVTSLDDGRVSPMEGLMLGVKGMAVAQTVLIILQGSTAADRQAIVNVLEHGTFTVPPAA